MNFSKLLLTISLFSFAIQVPIQASNFGLKSRAIIGLFAASGSALATGAALVADSFKKNELANAQLKIAQLENEVNYRAAKDLMNTSFNDGLFFGAVFTIMAGCLIVGIAKASEQSHSTSPAEILANDKKELAVKA